MKYEAFVQRDQVSGQTKEHCLSGVHLGKDRQEQPCEWPTILHTDSTLLTWRELLI